MAAMVAAAARIPDFVIGYSMGENVVAKPARD
jgi:hypothetical protein